MKPGLEPGETWLDRGIEPPSARSTSIMQGTANQVLFMLFLPGYQTQ